VKAAPAGGGHLIDLRRIPAKVVLLGVASISPTGFQLQRSVKLCPSALQSQGEIPDKPSLSFLETG